LLSSVIRKRNGCVGANIGRWVGGEWYYDSAIPLDERVTSNETYNTHLNQCKDNSSPCKVVRSSVEWRHLSQRSDHIQQDLITKSWSSVSKTPLLTSDSSSIHSNDIGRVLRFDDT
jgi:hypothetical protein